MSKPRDRTACWLAGAGVHLWVLLAAVSLMSPGAVRAQAKKDAPKKEAAAPKTDSAAEAKKKAREAAKAKRLDERRGGAGAKRVILKGETYYGKLRKPEVEYILQRSAVSYEGLRLKTKLTPKIVEAVKAPPF